MKSLPQSEVDSVRLQREVTDATDLYVGLLNKAQELRVVKSGTIGDVRIIDRAQVPPLPSRPRKAAVLMLSLMLGLTLGAATAIVRRALAKYAESPDEVEAVTGLPVFVTVPRSVAQADASRRKGGPLLLSATDPQGSAIETFRSLRTSLQFALVEAHNSVVAVTGPAPGVGKSFVAMNLAQVLAAAGKKVLLVDCDLRRGRIHRQFGLERKPGLSDFVSGAASLEQAIRPTDEKDLFLLSTGRIPPNPAELLSTARFESLLLDASKRFDLVVVDTPPILAVSDAMLVARLAGVNLLVLRAGMHNAREIGLAVKQFDLNGVRLNGSVLNDMRAHRGGQYGGAGYLRYEYQSDHPDTA
jgi:tyrosine-protein kinase Etk/Wzc